MPTTVAYVGAGLIISAISKQERIIRLNTFGFVAARYHIVYRFMAIVEALLS